MKRWISWWLRVVLVSIGVLFSVVSVSAESLGGGVEFSSKVGGESITYVITNNSDAELRNATIIYSEDGRYVGSRNVLNIGTVDAKSKVEVSNRNHKVENSALKKVIYASGGYTGFLLRIFIVLIAIGICIIVLNRFRKKISVKRFAYASIITVVILIGFTVSLFHAGMVVNSQPKTIDGGLNYRYELDTAIRKNGDVKVSFLYSQDLIEVKTDTKEESIPFEIEYRYDSNIPVTKDPTVEVEGVPGKKFVVYENKYLNGAKVSTKSSEEVFEEPVSEIRVQGTKQVLEKSNIPADKEYIPDDSMMVGEFKLISDPLVAKGNVGKKEIAHYWDKTSKTVKTKVSVVKKQGINKYKAGTIVSKKTISKASTKYIASKKMQVGKTKVIEETRDGVIESLYTTEIDTKTGEAIPGATLVHIKTEKTKPLNGEIQVGVLRVSEEEVTCETKVEYASNKWDNYVEVLEKGSNGVDKVTCIMDLDTNTGKVLDKVKEEVSRETVKKPVDRHELRGSMVPNWVQEKVMTEQVQYNTIYTEDTTGTLSGGEQKIVQKGKMGRLYTTQLVACNNSGDKIEGYEPQVIEKDALVPPTDEIVKVAKGSELLVGESSSNN